MTPQQYCLRWKHHHSNVQSMFAQLLEKERFCDVTLYCSPSFAAQVPNKDTVEPQSIRGVSLRAHRVVLAACSELLGTLLGAHEAHGEPVLVIDGAEPKHLKALLDYMYTGEMNVHHSQLASLLKTAEELRIKGLTDIRWNNKDEPPDCASVATTTVPKTDKDPLSKDPEPKKQDTKKPAELKKPDLKKQETAKKNDVIKQMDVKKQLEAKLLRKSPERALVDDGHEPRHVKEEERFYVNGGPPPLIKLPLPKSMSTPKREHSDSESPSPKRQRLVSGNDHTDEETNCVPKTERDTEQWHHGNMDISAMRVDAGWEGSPSSDEEWADAPTDIGSFLHTKLRVDGDNTGDEESNDSAPSQVLPSRPESGGSAGPNPTPPLKNPLTMLTLKREINLGAKSGPSDTRFNDVIRLHDYLQHGRRPQFWEEHYVKRVMEAVRLKELEMKQAAEILGVSYGTLYGRYRDVYGCINRPYRAARDFWQVKGPSEVLERLQRGEITLDAAASALGVSVPNLAAHIADFPANQGSQGQGDSTEFEPIPIETRKTPITDKQLGYVKIAPRLKGLNPTIQADTTDFEPIPIEVDASLRPRTYSGSAPAQKKPTATDKPALTKLSPKVVKCLIPNASDDVDAIPAHIISTDKETLPTGPSGAKWSGIRVASIDSLRNSPPPPTVSPSLSPSPLPSPSPSQLMRTRPDLTIVAKKPETRDDT